MKQKKITIRYEDTPPEVVAFRLDFEKLPADMSDVPVK